MVSLGCCLSDQHLITSVLFFCRLRLKCSTSLFAHWTQFRKVQDRPYQRAGPLSYYIASGNLDNAFHIDQLSGELSIKKPLDYENIEKYVLWIEARDQGFPPYSAYEKVEIAVLDVNDNHPTFEQEPFHAEILENLSPQRVLIVSAFDQDSGPNGQLEYAIIEGNQENSFSINRATGEIRTTRPLDREKGFNGKIFYFIRSQTEHFRINSSSGEIFIKHVKVASSLTADTNKVYLLEITASNDDGLFSINSQTGVLSLAKPLDYETKQKHELRVSATDGGWIAKTSYVTVNVLVTDVNDNPPVFDPVEYFPVVQENVPSGTTVVKMNATDKDSGPNALMAYVIQSSDSDLFIIDPNTGIITTQGFLDYEAKQVYHLTVKAFNVPDEERCSFAYVNIQLRGANEYVPRFVSKQYYFEVSEAASKGTVVGEVFASDRDLGEDGIVYYLIFGRSKKRSFSINKKTGQIYVTGPLDREKEEKISLKVLAKNKGSIRGADIDEVLVNITILDANDPPVFTQELYDVQVNEGLSPGGLVTFVNAEDSDSVPSWSRFTYAITANYEKSTFTINPQTGQVSVASELDRESVPVYNLTILAVDSGSPAATGSAILIVTLEDINDNGPTLETTSGEVMENQRAGTPVITLRSSDPDLAPNQGPFSYSLVSTGAASSYFTLSPTGELTTSREIDREQISDFYLSVIIKDSGIPQMSSTGTVHIKINDQNDNPSESRSVEIYVHYFGNMFPGGSLGFSFFMPFVLERYIQGAEKERTQLKFMLDHLYVQ
uniref:Cadherin domain-containing protein n=1 Tax=Sinocyclocheilus rhinocerous TaxID=307959 RepID=A0A673FLZ2_9TELE